MVKICHPFIGWSIFASTGYSLDLFSSNTDRKLNKIDSDFRDTLWPFSRNSVAGQRLVPDLATDDDRAGLNFSVSGSHTKRLLARILMVFQE